MQRRATRLRRAIAYISKRRYATSAKKTQAKTHKPRARRPTPAAVVFRYTICGRALLRYSNVAARNTRRSVSQPVYTRRSHASEDARAAVRRAMRRSVRAADAPRARRLFLQVRACDGDVQAAKLVTADVVRPGRFTRKFSRGPRLGRYIEAGRRRQRRECRGLRRRRRCLCSRVHDRRPHGRAARGFVARV